MAAALSLEAKIETLQNVDPLPIYGRVTNLVGLTIEATGPAMHVGDLCHIQDRRRTVSVPAEVAGFRNGRVLLMPLGDTHGIGPNSILVPTYAPLKVSVGEGVIGRVIGGLGQPIDGGGPIEPQAQVPLMAPPPRPMERTRINQALSTGVRAIDGCLTCGMGQRVGIMAGSGVGKSKLIGMIARNTNADVNVIALIGERGREVRDFVEADLGDAGLSRSVVVAATSDEPALIRIKGAYVATAIAEWFRDRGANVLLIMDSVTRFAMAQREVGLAIGEPPTTKGYPPSVYGLLPKLLERAGRSERGSITGFYNVLVEGDDVHDPVGDAVRSILDGHIVLSRDLFSRGHYPAIDVLASISRVMPDVVSANHLESARSVRRVLATYRDAEDLVNIGAYVRGSNPDIDTSLRLMPKLRTFLQQGLQESSSIEDAARAMEKALG